MDSRNGADAALRVCYEFGRAPILGMPAEEADNHLEIVLYAVLDFPKH